MQSQQTKGELIIELVGKTDSFSIRDISPNGVKMENNDVGQVSGKYNGNFMETVYIHMKTDGTSDWEGKGIQMIGKDMVVVTGHGKGKQNADGTVSFEGEQKFMTQSPNLAWLNSVKGWIEGSATQQDQSFTAKVYNKK